LALKRRWIEDSATANRLHRSTTRVRQVDRNLEWATEVETKLIRRAALRIMPFLIMCYFVSFIDRVNIGFASFQMESDIHISPAILGLGGGLYFVSYVLFEVPSNIFILKQGVRLFLARIMITWGIISTCMALVQGPWSFSAMRFVLGAAEAGLFPGVILYLTYWFPKSHRATYVGWFALAIPLSSFFGSPLSAALLHLNGVLGLAGWQWLFIAEGLPAVLLGIVCIFYVDNHPEDARWLSPAEREIYRNMLERDRAPNEAGTGHAVPLWRVLCNPRVLGLAVVLAASSATSNTFAVWAPRFIKSFQVSDMAAGWLNSVPFLLGAVAVIAAGYHSDRRSERIWHTAVPLIVAALATAAMMVSSSFLPSYLLLGLTVVGIYASKAPTWAVATEWLPDNIKAAGIAQINAISSLISFFPIYLVGLIRQAHGSYALAFLPMAFISGGGAVLLLVMNYRRQRTAASSFI
jgi:ACS family tartrate transporter-like MFS transporter